LTQYRAAAMRLRATYRLETWSAGIRFAVCPVVLAAYEISRTLRMSTNVILVQAAVSQALHASRLWCEWFNPHHLSRLLSG